MSWPTTAEANNFKSTFVQGFVDVSGGDYINRNGGVQIMQHHVNIGMTSVSNSTASIEGNQQLSITIPLFLNELKYFCYLHGSMIENFDIGAIDTSRDKTYYVRLNDDPFSPPYYIFSDTENGPALNGVGSRLQLYRGSSYTFVRTDNGHPFNIGTAWNENNSGMLVHSSGNENNVSGSALFQYPLTVNGTANIKGHLYVERDLSLNGDMVVDGSSKLSSVSADSIVAGTISSSAISTGGTLDAQSYNVGAYNVISATRQVACADLEVGSSKVLMYGDTGNASFEGTLDVDTINEKTSSSGVTVEGVLLKNGSVEAGSNSTITATNFNVGSKNVISASAQGSLTDLELKNNGNTGLLAFGETGNMELTGTLSIDTINEKTSSSGVSVEGVLLKNGSVQAGSNSTITATNFNVGSKNIVSASAQASFTDLELKNNGNTGLLVFGETGNMDLLGTIDITGQSIMRSDLSLNGAIRMNSVVRQF